MKDLTLKASGLILPFIITSFISCIQSGPPAVKDIQEVKDLEAQYNEVLNKHDAKLLAAYNLENADITFPTGKWIKERDSMPGLTSGLTRDYEVEDLRFLDGNTAILDFNNHFTGGMDDAGNKIPDIWNASTVVLTRQNGKWMRAATRIFPARIDNAEAERGIRDSWEHFIGYVEKGDAANLVGYFTADAINMVPGATSDIGRPAIQKLLAQFLSTNTIRNARVTTEELDLMGRKAVEFGIYEDTIEPKNGKSFNRKLRYYSVWQLEPDNVWRIHRFIFNDMP